MKPYIAREHALDAPRAWSLDGGTLIARRRGSDELRLTLSRVRVVDLRLGPAANPLAGAVLTVATAGRVARIPARNGPGHGRADGQRAAFRAFVTALHDELRARAPQARYRRGRTPRHGLLALAGGLVGIGAVSLIGGRPEWPLLLVPATLLAGWVLARDVLAPVTSYDPNDPFGPADGVPAAEPPHGRA